jgi:hypothetical protein
VNADHKAVEIKHFETTRISHRGANSSLVGEQWDDKSFLSKVNTGFKVSRLLT